MSVNFDSHPPFKWMLSSFPLTLWPIIFFKLSFTFEHYQLKYFLPCDTLFWLGVTSAALSAPVSTKRNGVQPNQTSILQV